MKPNFYNKYEIFFVEKIFSIERKEYSVLYFVCQLVWIQTPEHYELFQSKNV